MLVIVQVSHVIVSFGNPERHLGVSHDLPQKHGILSLRLQMRHAVVSPILQERHIIFVSLGKQVRHVRIISLCIQGRLDIVSPSWHDKIWYCVT